MILRFKAQEINIAAHISDRINCLRIAIFLRNCYLLRIFFGGLA